MDHVAPEAKRYAPAAARNRVPIRDVLARVLPARGLVLEIASGTGEHAAFFAAAFPALAWQPSDPDAANRASIAAWREGSGAANLRAPLDIGTEADDWGLAAADAVLCINMIHIAPWSAAAGLARGAARLLPPGGILFLYGPFTEGGRHTAESNAAFDAGLRAQNPAWGVRDAGDVAALAAAHGFARAETVVMPANNRSLVIRRA
jgi:SAM-dependent methyltransferase